MDDTNWFEQQRYLRVCDSVVLVTLPADQIVVSGTFDLPQGGRY
jgi:hypothetical protein